MSEAARSRRADVRFEPQFGATAGPAGVSSDPLAELARLVGQDDPFRNVFRATPGQGPATEPHVAEEHHPDGDAYPDEQWTAADEAYASDHEAYAAEPYAEDVDAYAAETAADERYYAHSIAAHPDEAGIADEHAAPEAADAALLALPDVWARDDGRVDGYAPAIEPAAEDVRSLGRDNEKAAARRPLVVLAAVLLLTGGGLAATFLAKGASVHGAIAADRNGTPTIMAATGPTKVKLDDTSTTAPEDQDAALLSKNGKADTGPVKVVASEEQPVDLGQLPKSPDLAEGAQPLPPPSSPFPEPKKVKTFLVHLDGTTLSAEPGQGQPTHAEAAPPAPTQPAEAETGTPVPATPRTTAKGGTTPKAMSIASLSADAPTDTLPPKAARQPASPGAHATASKPIEVADEGESPTGFGLQLAASPSESDAQAAFAKLKKKYPLQLGPYTASIHKSETGDKPVYRVRVGGLSQADAKTLCSELQSSGGSCFVVHNR